MASISKLSVRGVRSFSPEGDEQVIAFGYPLTIIVGQNGCGKTTIIESLKYAVTGALPPAAGTKSSGQAFVHDPKSFGASNVKANVKLRFNNRAGNSMVVIRSMEVTQKKTTLAFKALDGILRTMDETTGKRVAMSHKCGELDRQIPQLMGVSKAILEHVMFCHQEDSNWPLREGAELKKRFDDIFDSTRYTKALKAIQETRKKFYSNAKDLKADVAGLNSHKFAAEGFRRELEGTKESASRMSEEIELITEKVEEEQQKIDHYAKIRESVDLKKHELTELQTELRVIQERCDTLRSKLKEESFDEECTIDELQEELKNFERKLAKKEEKAKAKSQEVERLDESISVTRENIQQLSMTKGRLEHEVGRHVNCIKDRDTVLKRIASKYNISLHIEIEDSDDLPDSEIVRFSDRLVNLEQSLNDDVKEIGSRRQQKDDEIQAEITELNSAIHTLDADVARVKKERTNAESELKILSSENTRGSKVRKHDVDEARRTYEGAVKDRDEANGSNQLNQILKDLNSNKSELATVRQKLADEKDVLSELQKYLQRRNDIKLLEGQIISEKERLREAFSEHKYLFEAHGFNASPDDLSSLEVLSNAVRDAKIQKTKLMEASNSDLAKKREAYTKVNALLDNENRQGARIRQEIKKLRSATDKAKIIVSEFCKLQEERNITGDASISPDVKPQEFLSRIDDELNGLLGGADDPQVVHKIIEALLGIAAENMVCPCCKRGMDVDEGQAFADNMKALQREKSELFINLQSQATRNNAMREKYESWKYQLVNNDTYSSWQKSLSLKEDLIGINVNISNYQRDRNEARDELKHCESLVDDLRSELQTLETAFLEASSLRDDAVRINEKEVDIKGKKRSLEAVMAMSIEGSDSRSLEAVEASISSLDSKQDQLSKTRERLMDEQTKLNKRIQFLNDRVSNTQEELSQKEKKFAKDCEAAARKQQLNENVSKLMQDLRRYQQEQPPLRQRLREKETDKQRIRDDFFEEEGIARENLDKFLGQKSHFTRLNRDIERFRVSGKDQELVKVRNSVMTANEEIAEMVESKSRLEIERNNLLSIVRESAQYRNSILDGIQYLKAMKQEEKLENDISQLTEELKARSDIDDAAQKMHESNERLDEFIVEKSRCEGKLIALRDTLENLESKLSTREYKDIDERHRVKMIEFETTSIAVKDLEVYHNALDQALLQYHGMKIEDINKIIKDLWQVCYKGEDITNIKLVSDSGGKASKSYNYRVVMTKNGSTQLDMRGRCSAGQRVLAAIVIRLALAETFCLNCGVMTLDEPTTNLDYENKQGLAIALSQIIINRSNQSNFQLVIITHDEPFVSMLKQELSASPEIPMPERYFQVSREPADDGKYYSKITAVDWDEI